MANQDHMVIEELTASLRKKWELDDEVSSYRAGITAHVLENQARHFKRLVEETRALGVGSFEKDLFESLRSAFRTHVLPDLCSIQPMSGPIGCIFFYKPRPGKPLLPGEVVPELVLDIMPQEIRAESRMCKALRDEGAPFGAAVDSLLTEIAREILGTLLNCVPESNQLELAGGADLREELEKASHTVHRESQRAPANKLVGGKKMLTQLGVAVSDDLGEGIHDLGELDDKWDVYYDPLFPEGKLLTWYQAADSVMDTGIIYSPYTLVELTPNFVDPEDMTLCRAMRTRHKITLVRPAFVSLISLAGSAY